MHDSSKADRDAYLSIRAAVLSPPPLNKCNSGSDYKGLLANKSKVHNLLKNLTNAPLLKLFKLCVMDIHRLLNTPQRPRTSNLPPDPRSPRTPCPTRRLRACKTTRTDRIRIKAALNWATPRTVQRKYADEYGYTLRQIRLAQQGSITPKRKKCGRKALIPIEKAREMKAWLLSDPSHRHVSFHHLSAFAPELGLYGYGYEAIRTAFLKVGYGRRVAKRKGFSNDPAVMAYRLEFARDGLSWTRERLYR